jgi:hypothetical protein
VSVYDTVAVVAAGHGTGAAQQLPVSDRLEFSVRDFQRALGATEALFVELEGTGLELTTINRQSDQSIPP